MPKKTSLLLIAILLAPCHAQMPENTLAVSGLLKDSMGTPATGPVSILFSIHDSDSSGSVLWSELQPAVALDAEGRYQVTLGSVTPILPAVFADPNTWLTLEVNTDGEMTPRLPLGRVPTAHNAAFASAVQDIDEDTRIEVEASPDEDTIRFDLAGLERWTMQPYGGLWPSGSGGSIFLGFQSGLNDDQSSRHNTYVGQDSGTMNVSGAANVAIGFRALTNNTGDENTAVGEEALYANVTGAENVAVGARSLNQNLTSSRNTALGWHALQANTADGLTAIGHRALESNVSGGSNVAVGANALHSNVTGHTNTAVGVNALGANTANSNTAMGNAAMQSNLTGAESVAVGRRALFANASGTYNTAIGRSALANNIDGNGNVAVGRFALSDNTSGSGNSALGHFAGGAATLSNSTALGKGAIYTASNMVRIGDSSVTTIEGQVMFTAASDGRFKRNVLEDVPGLNFITRLRPVTYNMDTLAYDDFIRAARDLTAHEEAARVARAQLRETGFIAQEVEVAARSIGYDFNGVDAPQNDRDPYGLRYAAFVMPLVKGMQEQQELIASQAATISGLQQDIAEIRQLLGSRSPRHASADW